MKKKALLTVLSLIAANFVHASITIEFTEAEGYTTGLINSQNGWTGSTSYGVNTTTETLSQSANNFQTIYYGGASGNPAVESLTYVMEFNLDYTFAAANDNVFELRIARDTVGTDALRYQFRWVPATSTFNIKLFDAAGEKSPGTFSVASAGMTPGSDTLSDDLRLTINLTKGANASSWSFSSTMDNLTTATNIMNIAERSDIVSTAGFFADDSIFLGFNSQGGNETLTIDTLTLVPEPSTVALLSGLIALGGVLIRRRAKRG